MVCRAPNPAVGSCVGATNTGQQLSYDAEGRLSGWQNVPGGSPNATASFRYDGEGERVAQQSTTSGGGTTTTTRYLLGGLEELATSECVCARWGVDLPGHAPARAAAACSFVSISGSR